MPRHTAVNELIWNHYISWLSTKLCCWTLLWLGDSRRARIESDYDVFRLGHGGTKASYRQFQFLQRGFVVEMSDEVNDEVNCFTFPLTTKWNIQLYMCFTELLRQIFSALSKKFSNTFANHTPLFDSFTLCMLIATALEIRKLSRFVRTQTFSSPDEVKMHLLLKDLQHRLSRTKRLFKYIVY